MKSILLCSSNRGLVRTLYGMLGDDGNTVDDVEHPSLAVQRVLKRTYDLLVIDAEPFGLNAEEAARIVAALAPEMAIFCVGGDPRTTLPSAISLPAEPDAIRDLIRHVAARSPLPTVPEGSLA